jgi:hypothetical protein
MRIEIVEDTNVDAERLCPGRLEDPDVRYASRPVMTTLLYDGEGRWTIDAEREAVSLDRPPDRRRRAPSPGSAHEAKHWTSPLSSPFA